MVQHLSENSTGRGRFFRYAPLILWIGIIFYLSSSGASMSNTSRFIRPLLEFLFPNTLEATLTIYHGYIRKLAHPTVYAVLAFLAARSYFTSSIQIIRKNWFIISLITVFTVASLDELNQSFNPLRTGTFYDVLLDSAGGLIMLLVFMIFLRCRKSE